jgi:hypothetical protein
MQYIHVVYMSLLCALQAKHATASVPRAVAAAASARQLHTTASRAARSLGAVPHIDAFRVNNRFVTRNITCSAATATKEETFTYQAEVSSACGAGTIVEASRLHDCVSLPIIQTSDSKQQRSRLLSSIHTRSDHFPGFSPSKRRCAVDPPGSC